MIKSFMIFFFIISTNLSGSEVDSYNKRPSHDLKDASSVINIETNRMIQEAIKLANESSSICHEKKLYKKLRIFFRNHIFGQLTHFILTTDQIDRIVTPVQESIYQDFTWTEAPITGFYARKIKDPSGHLIRMGNVLMGTDKFEHFMGSGLRYFKKYYLGNKNIQEVLAMGKDLEDGMMGTITTGVFSYADLSANFNGMRFWNHLLQKNDDILGENLGPYLECQNEKWVQVKDFNWLDYVDQSFDEAINCNKYRNASLMEKVKKRIHLIEKKENVTLPCPLDPEKLETLREKYPPKFYDELINTEGVGIL